MKGKIDSQGFLHIERAGVMKYQVCPLTTSQLLENDKGTPSPCGDWCPLFGEPYTWEKCKLDKNNDKVYVNMISINICNRHDFEFELSDFTDERGVK